MKPLPSASAATSDQAIYESVCAAILERRLTPGTKLQELQLGTLFGVSRTIVRRALARLALEGVVSVAPRRATIVARPSLDEARQTFAARRLVESAIVPLVVAGATNAIVAGLRRMVRDEQSAYRRGDRGTGIRCSVDFHLRLSELSGNTMLTRFTNELVLRSSLIIALYEPPWRAPHHDYAHARLVDAIAGRNVRQAVRLMNAHLLELEDELDLGVRPAPLGLADILTVARIAEALPHRNPPIRTRRDRVPGS